MIYFCLEIWSWKLIFKTARSARLVISSHGWRALPADLNIQYIQFLIYYIMYLKGCSQILVFLHFSPYPLIFFFKSIMKVHIMKSKHPSEEKKNSTKDVLFRANWEPFIMKETRLIWNAQIPAYFIPKLCFDRNKTIRP